MVPDCGDFLKNSQEHAAIPAGLMTPGSVAPFGARSPGASLCHPIEGFRHFWLSGNC